ncbi:hypothetical protein OC861_002731 [Tilletia horrida]|nr:hypothetical protein OC861_002731 [Tilletia horrida]
MAASPRLKKSASAAVTLGGPDGSASPSSSSSTLNASQRLLAEVLAPSSSSAAAAPAGISSSRKRRKLSHHRPDDSTITGLDKAAEAEEAEARLNSHLKRVGDGTVLVLTNPARPRKLPDPESALGKQLRKRDKRVVQRAQKEARVTSARDAKGKGREEPKEASGEGKAGQHTAPGPLSRKEKKRLGFMDLHPQLTYASLLPLASLWQTYVQQLIGLRQSSGSEIGAINPNGFKSIFGPPDPHSSWTVRQSALSAMQSTLSRADLTGAQVRDPARVGLSGLVARESENTFLIAPEPAPADSTAALTTEAQESQALRQRRSARSLGQGKGRKAPQQLKLKVVPKHNTVFEVTIPVPPFPASITNHLPAGHADSLPTALTVALYGNQMTQSFPTRATKKYKARKSIDF